MQPSTQLPTLFTALYDQTVDGLLHRTPPCTPCELLYDNRGSELFDEITRLDEYYPTRTEEAILAAQARAIVEAVEPEALVELGSGMGKKIRLLLKASESRPIQRVLFIDVNPAVLESSSTALRASFPGLEVRGWEGDFRNGLPMPSGRRLVLLLAGTIGNMRPDEARRLLSSLASKLTAGDALLVGVDLVKPRSVLERAYNDAAGVTAAFNRNVLLVLNRLVGSDFDPAAFDHRAVWDEEHARIEMRLIARYAITTHVAGHPFALAAGQFIRTEISCKYTRARFAALLVGLPLALTAWLTDRERLFALALTRRR